MRKPSGIPESALAGLLSLLLGCGSGEDPAGNDGSTGAITVRFETIGPLQDGDGYVAVLDGRESHRVVEEGLATFEAVPTGTHRITLEDVDPSCEVGAPGPERTVNVEAGRTAEVAAPVYCGDMARRILFMGRSGGEKIHSIRADGSEPGRIFTTGFEQGGLDPAWSPDGAWIAYTRWLAEAPGDLWVQRADGTGARAVTTDGALDRATTWSPDGERLAFSSIRRDQGLWVVDREGSDPVRITDGFAQSPSWSSDDRIAFIGMLNPPAGQRDIFVVHPDGSDRVNLTSGRAAYIEDPTWSPDGARLAYIDVGRLWLINADGTDRREIFGVEGEYVRSVAWSPSGQLLAVSHTQDGRQVLGVLTLGGPDLDVIHESNVILSLSWH